jgi:hypothetical protein
MIYSSFSSTADTDAPGNVHEKLLGTGLATGSH